MDKFPPLSDIKKSIEILRNEKWPKFKDFKNVDEFNDYFHQKFSQHFNRRMVYGIIALTDFDYKFYRVRPLEEVKDKSSIREYSYPPPEYCVQHRANLPGFPVFYSSPKAPIALLETIRNNDREAKDRKYCISMWEIVKRKKFCVSPLIHHVENELYAKLSRNILNEKMVASLKGTPHESDTAAFRAITEFLSGSFVSDIEDNYSISSFIGHSHLYMPNEYRSDFFMYPSIQAERKDINIAVNPTTVDENLALKFVLISEVDFDLANNNVQLVSSEFGVCDGTKVVFNRVGTSNDNLDPAYVEILKQFDAAL